MHTENEWCPFGIGLGVKRFQSCHRTDEPPTGCLATQNIEFLGHFPQTTSAIPGAMSIWTYGTGQCDEVADNVCSRQRELSNAKRLAIAQIQRPVHGLT